MEQVRIIQIPKTKRFIHKNKTMVQTDFVSVKIKNKMQRRNYYGQQYGQKEQC